MRGGAKAMVAAGTAMAGVGSLGMVLLATGRQFQFMYSEDGELKDENWSWDYAETEDEPRKILIRAHEYQSVVLECAIKWEDEEPLGALGFRDQLDEFIGEMKIREKRRNFIGNCEKEGEFIVEVEKMGGNKFLIKNLEDLYGKNLDEGEDNPDPELEDKK